MRCLLFHRTIQPRTKLRNEIDSEAVAEQPSERVCNIPRIRGSLVGNRRAAGVVQEIELPGGRKSEGVRNRVSSSAEEAKGQEVARDRERETTTQRKRRSVLR